VEEAALGKSVEKKTPAEIENQDALKEVEEVVLGKSVEKKTPAEIEEIQKCQDIGILVQKKVECQDTGSLVRNNTLSAATEGTPMRAEYPNDGKLKQKKTLEVESEAIDPSAIESKKQMIEKQNKDESEAVDPVAFGYKKQMIEKQNNGRKLEEKASVNKRSTGKTKPPQIVKEATESQAPVITKQTKRKGISDGNTESQAPVETKKTEHKRVSDGKNNYRMYDQP